MLDHGRNLPQRHWHAFRNEVRWARWLRRLPGSSNLWGPPRHGTDMLDYARRHGTEIHSIPVPACRQRRPSCWFGAPNPSAGSIREVESAVRVMEIADGRLLWPAGTVVGAGDTLLTDVSFWTLCDQGGLQRHPIGQRWWAKRRRRLPGRTLCLASDFPHAFGHFVLESLPRLDYLRQAGWSVTDFDHIVLARPRSPTVDRLIAAAGIPPDRVVDFQSEEDFICDRLVFTSYPGIPGICPEETVRYYRTLLGPPPATRGRRIYLSRQLESRRKLANAEAVEAILAEHGFETVFPATDPATIAKLSEADLVVGVEGSNLVNLVFARPGVRLLLLVADSWADLPYAYSIVTANAGTFYGLQGTTRPDESSGERQWTNPQDVIIDPEALRLALARCISDAS